MTAGVMKTTAVILAFAISCSMLSGCGLDEEFWEEILEETDETEESRQAGSAKIKDGAKNSSDGSGKIGDILIEDEGYEADTAGGSVGDYAASVDAAVAKINGKITDNHSAVREKQVELKNDGTDVVTVLVYMNGSNLETEYGEATTDLTEMIAAGSSDKVNVLVETVGTKKWRKKYGIASDHSQIYKVENDGLTLVKDDLGQLDCAAPETLSDFIKWGVKNYPADRYILQLWGHGSGPVYGFGMDDRSDDEDTLATDEIQQALSEAGVFFDFIGMDCCVMSCLEVCLALNGYCDYMILSEDFESGLGWSYTGWLKQLMQNSSTDTVTLAKCAIDDMVADNEQDDEGGDSILALIDESMIKVLFTAWVDFAYANEDELFDTNYSRKIARKGPSRGFLFDWAQDFFSDDADMSDLYITDIMAVAENIDSPEADALKSAVSQAVVYSNATEGDKGFTGISVTLPYSDPEFYAELENVFLNCGIDEEYIEWLSGFAGEASYDSYFDYNEWDDSWEGWDEYDDDYDWEDWEYYDDDEYWEDEDYWCSSPCLADYNR